PPEEAVLTPSTPIVFAPATCPRMPDPVPLLVTANAVEDVLTLPLYGRFSKVDGAPVIFPHATSLTLASVTERLPSIGLVTPRLATEKTDPARESPAPAEYVVSLSAFGAQTVPFHLRTCPLVA